MSNRSIECDTISGVFLFEINIPEKCYSRFDQVEQGSNLIYYNKIISKKNITKLYKKGVFVLGYEDYVTDFATQNHLTLFQDRSSIDSFMHNVSYLRNRNTKYSKNLIHDTRGLLLYKKLYAKLVVKNIGNRMQMIPKLKNYRCCYSNATMAVKTFFVLKIINYKIY